MAQWYKKAIQQWNAVRGDGCTSSPDLAYTECCNRHDKDYTTGTDENGFKITRAQADKRLYECMKRAGVTPIVGRFIVPAFYYIAVRLFGGSHWEGNKRK